MGRLKMLISSLMVGSLAIISCGLATNLFLFLFCIYVVGFGMLSFETAVYVYISEISGIRYRSISSNLLFMIWAIS